MQIRLITTAALIVGLQLVYPTPAGADDAALLVSDDDNVTLTSKDDGTAAATVILANPGTPGLDVTVEVGDLATDGCEIDPPDDATLDAHRQQKMTFTLSAACDPKRKEGTDFTLTAGTTTFDIHANPPKAATPNWTIVGTLYLLFAVAAGALLYKRWRVWMPPPGAPARSNSMALHGLDSSWKFSESWAVNATVVTALFTGLFGAKDVTNALLGEENATNLIAIALVAAAISVGLTGLSPMVLQACRRWFPKVDAADPVAATAHSPELPAFEEIPAGLYVTPRGLLLAAWLTFTGTAGQLAVIVWALRETDFWSDVAILGVGVVAVAVLGWYLWKSTGQNLTAGASRKPKKPEPVKDAGMVQNLMAAEEERKYTAIP